MKNLFYLLVIALLFASCRKETIQPENIVRYEVSCDQCTVEFTDNTQMQALSVTGFFQTMFKPNDGIRPVLKVSSFFIEQNVSMKIISPEKTVKWSGKLSPKQFGKTLELW